jgi:hypothetical protein
MENIVMITGKVKYKITLDPGVWIFDDRKEELHSFFQKKTALKDDLDAYTKDISTHWDREITEGAVVAPTLKTEKKFLKEKLLTGSLAIPFKPFLKNSSPDENATQIIVETEQEEFSFDIATGYDFILGFSNEGKPLSENGPIHVYLGDGSNQTCPIINVKGFRVE